MNKLENQNDWWKYLAHAAKAEEMPGHKYIARVEIGTRRGKTLYRYFYTMDQYKYYLSQQKTGAKSEAEKRQSPLYNLKRLAAQVKAFAKDNNEANNGRSYKERNAARSRLSYDKVLLQTTGKEFIDSVLDKLNIPAKDVDKISYDPERKHLYIKRVAMPNGKYRYFYTEDSYNKYLQRVQYQANEPEFMKDIPEIDRYTDETDAQTQAYINEDYSAGSDARSKNCIFCSNAYELRQRGYDVYAGVHRSSGDDSDSKYGQTETRLLHWYEKPDVELIEKDGATRNINKALEYYDASNGLVQKLKGLDKETQAQLDAYTSSRGYQANDLRKAIKSKCPPNSRGMLNVTWAGGRSGHSVVFEVDKNGNVVFRDTQVNQIYTAEYLADNIWSARFIRTDNLKLKEDILYTVEAN